MSLTIQLIKKYGGFLFFGIALVVFMIIRYTGHTKKDGDAVHVYAKTYHTDAGWGYDIYTNDSLFIHQEYMPAAPGHKGFENREDAEKISALVISKMKKSHLPVVTLAELDEQGIRH